MFGNIDELTLNNNHFRKVIESGKHLQLVVMSLGPKEDIGVERHNVDQFIRVERGIVLVELNGEPIKLKKDGYVVIHAGTTHNITNLSKTRDAKLYTIYSRPLHTTNCIQKKRKDKEC